MGQAGRGARFGGWWTALLVWGLTLLAGAAFLRWWYRDPVQVVMKVPHGIGGEFDERGERLDAFRALARSEGEREGSGREEAGKILHLLIGDECNFDLKPGTPRTWADGAVVDCVAGGGSDAEEWFVRRIRIEGAHPGGRLTWIEVRLQRESGRPPEWWGCAHDLTLGEFRAVMRTVEAAASVDAVPGDELSWDPRWGPVQPLLVWDWLKVRGLPQDFLEECRTPTLAVAEEWQRARITAVYRLAIDIARDEDHPCRAIALGDVAALRADYRAEAPPGDPWFHELHGVLFRALGDDEGLREADRRLKESRK